MDILFTSKLRKVLNDSKARQKEYGDLAKTIGRRLDDLKAVATLEEAFLLPGKLESLAGDRLGQFSMRLSANWRLILEPANEPPPRKEDGGIDLSRVTGILIVDVEDYHKK